MTVTVREKGKTLEESGGVVMTANSWLGPAIPAMKELAEFEMKYWKAIAPEAAGDVRRTDGRRGGDVPDGQAGDGPAEQGEGRSSRARRSRRR